MRITRIVWCFCAVMSAMGALTSACVGNDPVTTNPGNPDASFAPEADARPSQPLEETGSPDAPADTATDTNKGPFTPSQLPGT